MPSIKLHVGIFADNGQVNCDYRDRPMGHAEGDEHRTVLELDPASDEEVAIALEIGPRFNALANKMLPGSGLAELTGKAAGGRLGVWKS